MNWAQRFNHWTTSPVFGGFAIWSVAMVIVSLVILRMSI